MSISPAPLVACRECDLLMREVPLLPGKSAVCRCCGAPLYRNVPDSLDRTLALALAALMFFIIANVHPIFGIEIRGVRASANLFGAVHSLWNQGMGVISVLVFITTILTPTVELIMLIYLLLPLRFHRLPPGNVLILRILRGIKPWNMVEVFMLGVLVSIAKLTDLAGLIPGVSLCAFGVLTMLIALVTSYFDPHHIWAYLDKKCPNGMAV